MKNVFYFSLCFTLLMCVFSCSDNSVSPQLSPSDETIDFRSADCNDINISGAWTTTHPCISSGCAWDIVGPWGMQIVQDGKQLIGAGGQIGVYTSFQVAICDGSPSTTLEFYINGELFCTKTLYCMQNQGEVCDGSLYEITLISEEPCCTFSIEPAPGHYPMLNGQFLFQQFNGTYQITVCPGEVVVLDLADSNGGIICSLPAFEC